MPRHAIPGDSVGGADTALSTCQRALVTTSYSGVTGAPAEIREGIQMATEDEHPRKI